MLFLNAGALPNGAVGDFSKIVDDDLQTVVTVNVLHTIYLAKVLIAQIIQRKKRSAIVVTSSNLGSIPVPLCLPYSCSKTFISFLARGLSFELEDKVDCIDWTLGQVKTNLNQNPQGSLVLERADAVHGIMRQLGRVRSSEGAHETAFTTMIAWYTTHDWRSRYFLNMFRKRRMRPE